MLQFSVIGNLGNNAEVKNVNGRQFVTFDVAHTDSWTDAAGNRQSQITWVSCILNGDGGGLLPYLVKGKKVYVTGDGTVRVYSSKVQRRMMAGVNLNVRQIELIGGSTDEVPRRLATETGELLDVNKAYYVHIDKARELCPQENMIVNLLSERGEFFTMNHDGWVTKVQAQSENADAEPNQ